jgi:hypothetical protein
MNSLRGRIEALEKACMQVFQNRQLDYFVQALRGEASALAQLQHLRREGIMTGHLDELADAILIPLRAQAAGETDVDRKRPTI